MALINCPECGKEVSDKSRQCIHCGNPLVEDAGEEIKTQQVEITSLDIKGKNLKKTIVSIIIILTVVIGGIYGYNVIQDQAAESKLASDTNDYIENVTNIRSTMFLGALESETVANLIHDIWYNTIYENYDYRTDKYTISNYGFNDDFNDSLFAYFASQDYKDSITNINENQEVVKNIMKGLQNPPQGLDNVYSTITDMHEQYLKMCSNATNPTGNLTSYTQSINENSGNFLNLYEKLETQIPDIQE